VEDLGHTVRALGQLGVPLREVVAVQGVWAELPDGPAKPGIPWWFQVTEVNRQRLARPVGFRSLDVEIIDRGGKAVDRVQGERWELRAYETWTDLGHPAAFVQELGEVSPAPPARGVTRLVGLLKTRQGK
jgi:hypothetical protein